ncbi:MerR family transcriptional regulator [Phytohabitans kaempferiae]|uniref:MerR family transcriptional regulator n=1 Tax=Phytohabitans kaempferiae TaxID=1620943 RepID=A0ABV6MGA4_9ACTN
MRTVDLARAAGVSTQQIRNYEDAGVLPPVPRTASGYRTFDERHLSAVLTYRALAAGHGPEPARAIMRTVLAGDVAGALALVDAGHAGLHEERAALRATASALEAVAALVPPPAPPAAAPAVDSPGPVERVAVGGAGLVGGAVVDGPGPVGGVAVEGVGLLGRVAVDGAGPVDAAAVDRPGPVDGAAVDRAGSVGGLGGGQPSARVEAGRAAASVELSVGELAAKLGVRPSALRVWEAAGLLEPRRERVTGYRRYGPADVRDAQMIRMLRQSGYLFPQIAPILDGLRRTGSSEALREAVARRQAELTRRSAALLDGAAHLSRHLSLPPT